VGAVNKSTHLNGLEHIFFVLEK